ncbi:MAG: alpha/beta hydrolase [Dehalococcoidia bacterium]
MTLGYIEADRTFRFTSDVDGFSLQNFVWERPGPKAVVVIAHGAAEHSLRYGRFARALNAAGFEVWSLDHRGHGESPGPEGLGDFGEGGWDARSRHWAVRAAREAGSPRPPGHSLRAQHGLGRGPAAGARGLN